MTTENSPQNQGPYVTLAFQFVKDLTVENPSILSLLKAQESEIDTELSADVMVHPAEDNLFEIILQLKLTIQKNKEDAFIIELSYAGVFSISNADQDMLPFILHVQCPHLLFPSARHIIRSLVQESGLPGFNLQNIDFMDLFRQKVEGHQSSEGSLS
jgi:preprotein translocase subunit SecB